MIVKSRQTCGDSVSQPDWAERFRLTVGPGPDADLRGESEKAIQAAVDLVSRHGGGTVEILRGTYKLRNAIFLTMGLRLIGQGSATILRKEPSVTTPVSEDSDWYDQEVSVEDASGFRLGDGICLMATDRESGRQIVLKRTLVARSGNRFKLDKALRESAWRRDGATVSTLFPILSGEFVSDITIENLVLDGNRSENALIDGNHAGCVFLHDCNRVNLRNIHARDFNGDGVSWQISHDIVVENSVSEGHSGLGLHPGSGSQRPIIRGNTLRNNDTGLFFCWGVRDGRAESNQIELNRVGVSVGHRDTAIRISENSITGNTEAGIIFRPERGEGFAAHHDRVFNNVFRDNGGPGGAVVDIQGTTHHIEIAGNTFEDTRKSPADCGIRMSAQAREIKLDANTVRGIARATVRAPSTPLA